MKKLRCSQLFKVLFAVVLMSGTLAFSGNGYSHTPLNVKKLSADRAFKMAITKQLIKDGLIRKGQDFSLILSKHSMKLKTNGVFYRSVKSRQLKNCYLSIVSRMTDARIGKFDSLIISKRGKKLYVKSKSSYPDFMDRRFIRGYIYYESGYENQIKGQIVRSSYLGR